MKYARNVAGVYLDPVEIPQPWPENYWTNDPVEFCERMFPGTTGWESVPEDTGAVAPPPPPAPMWDALTFKRRFTQVERITIRGAAESNGAVQDFIDLLNTAAATGTMIHADDPDVVAGLTAFEQSGLIAVGRKNEILSA